MALAILLISLVASNCWLYAFAIAIAGTMVASEGFILDLVFRLGKIKKNMSRAIKDDIYEKSKNEFGSPTEEKDQKTRTQPTTPSDKIDVPTVDHDLCN